MLYKSAANTIDVDTQKRVVKGYFSIFNVEDSDHDIILPGAYKKTISENKRIVHLYQHDVTKPLSSVRSGKLKLEEDSMGLKFESEISDTSWGRDVLKLYEDGVIEEHSVGIIPVKKEMRNGIRNIFEVRMFEGSTVTFGANEYALGGLKAEKILKAFRHGTFENEEIFDLLEIYLKQLENNFVESKKENVILQSLKEFNAR